VELRRHEYEHGEACFGRLEALLARHWPELGQRIDVQRSITALRLLAETPSAASAAAAPDETVAFMARSSRGKISRERIEAIVADASATLGVGMQPEEERIVRSLAEQALAAKKTCAQIEHAMHALATDDEVFRRLCPWAGINTAAVIVTSCDPRQYGSARQLEKACGLNLREKSSGEHQGKLSITKRGPSIVRKVLYLLALRMIEEEPLLRAWYTRRRGYTEESKKRAVIAVMRKLIRAIFHVAKGNTFDATKLFDTRRLVEAPTTKRAQAKRASRIARCATNGNKEVAPHPS
jgi:hypothetical protein